MISLRGKRVLVTGASRGIGRLVAAQMARHGCDLVVHSRSLEHTRPVVSELAAFPVTVDPVAADLARPDEVESLLDTLEKRYPVIDVVFNNAGLQVAYRADFWHTPTDDFTTSMQVNLIAPAMICLRLVPAMLKQGFGRVINLTSGIRAEPEQSGYAASKAALEKFTRDLALKLDRDDVLLNLVDPGWCRTDLGGPNAPNDPASALPGVLVGAFIDDRRSGRIFRTQDYAGMTLPQAVGHAEKLNETC